MDKYPKFVLDLIEKMLFYDHQKRLTVDEIMLSLEKGEIVQQKRNLAQNLEIVEKSSKEIITELVLMWEAWRNNEIKTKVFQSELLKNSKLIESQVLEQKNEEAFFCMAIQYDGTIEINGIGIDEKKAFEYMSKASEQENPLALWNLGAYYLKEVGVKHDSEKGFSYIDKAAKKNNKFGFHWRGLCYEMGVGVEKNLGKAIKDYEKGKENGSSYCLYTLACLYEKGQIKDESGMKKIELLQMGIEKNNYNCMRKLVSYYNKGTFPLKKDQKKEEELTKLAEKCKEEYWI